MASKINNKKSDPSPKPIKKTKKNEAPNPAPPLNQDQGLAVVGIGASAGGLQALQTANRELKIKLEEIDRLKQAEADLVQLNTTLRQRVEERTRELEQANQRITQNRNIFDALFRANPIPTAITKIGDDVFISVNVEFLKYFSCEENKIIGHSAQEFGLGLEKWRKQKPAIRTREGFIDYLKQENKIGLYETQIEIPTRGIRTILASVQYIKFDSTDALITVFVDVTERTNAEQQIRALASELTAAEQTERHRIAQILHDDLQQRIFAIQMQMSFLKDAYEKNDLQAFKADFPQLEVWLAEAIQVTRRLSMDLNPPILRGEGLVETVLWLASQMQDQYGLEVDIKSEGNHSQLDEKVRVLVFYAVRELLFNIVKHSGTLKGTVNFEHCDDHLRLTVSDEGKGFDQATVMSSSKIVHSLLIIRRRLSLLGCSMNVESQPGKGTKAIIAVPYEKMDS